MSDNQSWNSSASEEDLETEPGQPVGIAEFGGVLSKVRQTRSSLAWVVRTRTGTVIYLALLLPPEGIASKLQFITSKTDWHCVNQFTNLD